MKRTILLLLVCYLNAGLLQAQPAGYYDNADGKQGDELRQALHDIIDDHTVLSYSYLWTAFYTTDARPDGTVWDMYSDIPDGPNPYDYTFGSDQCGNYSGEGSCYNREHSFPKSWFGDVAPMNTDLFHLYPTDGYVNGKRGNFPFGETAVPSWTSLNGSMVGPCSVTGYTGTIFEPIDEYKGDFARTYFYMTTRYFGEDAGWVGSPMTEGAELKPWARQMLMQWHTDDPVSPKEEERNEAVFAIQKNRNPYIDHPEYVPLLYVTGSIDEIAPVLDSISVISIDSLILWFNEPLQFQSATNQANYQVTAGVTVENAVLLADLQNAVILKVFGMENGEYSLIINGVADTTGNAMQFAIYSFSVNLVGERLWDSKPGILYPNPCSGNFYVQIPGLSSHLASAFLYDILGKRVPFSIEYSLGLYHIVSEITPGAYYFNLLFDNGNSYNFPVLVN